MWEMDSQNGCVKCHNWLQTCVKYNTVLNWRKDEMSGMKESCDQDGNEKSKWLWFLKDQVDGIKDVNVNKPCAKWQNLEKDISIRRARLLLKCCDEGSGNRWRVFLSNVISIIAFKINKTICCTLGGQW